MQKQNSVTFFVDTSESNVHKKKRINTADNDRGT